jgi:hypothetical protein
MSLFEWEHATTLCRKNWARIDFRRRRPVLIGELQAIGRAPKNPELASRISVREIEPTWRALGRRNR